MEISLFKMGKLTDRFEVVQNTHSTRFIKSKIKSLKHCCSCFFHEQQCFRLDSSVLDF